MKPDFSSKYPAIIKLVDGDPVLQSVKDLSDTHARHAYTLFESRGRQDGRDLEDWLRAESELLRPMPIEIDEGEDVIILRADLSWPRDFGEAMPLEA